MSTTFQTDVGKIKRILIKHAKDAFCSQAQIDSEWQQLHFLSKPLREAAIKEYDSFVELLDSFGMQIEFLPEASDTTLDSLYPRDNALATNNGMIICTMGKANRVSEPQHHRSVYDKLNIKIAGAIEAPGSVEGGDVTWLKNNVLCVANGYRTNPAGIAQLKELTKNCVTDFIELNQRDHNSFCFFADT